MTDTDTRRIFQISPVGATTADPSCQFRGLGDTVTRGAVIELDLFNKCTRMGDTVNNKIAMDLSMGLFDILLPILIVAYLFWRTPPPSYICGVNVRR